MVLGTEFSTMVIKLLTGAVQCSAVQYNAVQCSAVQYNAVQCAVSSAV